MKHTPYMRAIAVTVAVVLCLVALPDRWVELSAFADTSGYAEENSLGASTPPVMFAPMALANSYDDYIAISTHKELKALLEKSYGTDAEAALVTVKVRLTADITMDGIKPKCGRVIIDGAKPGITDPTLRSSSKDAAGHGTLENCFTIYEKGNVVSDAFYWGEVPFHTIEFHNVNINWKCYYGIVYRGSTHTSAYSTAVVLDNAYYIGPQIAHSHANTTMTLRDTEVTICKNGGTNPNSAMEVSRLHIENDVSIIKTEGTDSALNDGVIGIQCSSGTAAKPYPPDHPKAGAPAAERGLFVEANATLYVENKVVSSSSPAKHDRVFSDESGDSVPVYDIIIGDSADVTMIAPSGMSICTVNNLTIGKKANVTMQITKDYGFGFTALKYVYVENDATWHMHNSNGSGSLLHAMNSTESKIVPVENITIGKNAFVTLDRGKNTDATRLSGMLSVDEGSIFTATGTDSASGTDTSVHPFFMLKNNSGSCGVAVNRPYAFFMKGYILPYGSANTIEFSGTQFDAWRGPNINGYYSENFNTTRVNISSFTTIDYASSPYRDVLPVHTDASYSTSNTTINRQFVMSNVTVTADPVTTKTGSITGTATVNPRSSTETAAKYVPRGATPTANTDIVDESLIPSGAATRTAWTGINPDGTYEIDLATLHNNGAGWSYSSNRGYGPLVKQRQLVVYARVDVFPDILDKSGVKINNNADVYVYSNVLLTPSGVNSYGLVSVADIDFGQGHDIIGDSRIPMQNADTFQLVVEDGRDASPSNAWTILARATPLTGTYLGETVQLHADALQFRNGSNVHVPLSATTEIVRSQTDATFDLIGVKFPDQRFTVDPSQSIVAPIEYTCTIQWSLAIEPTP